MDFKDEKLYQNEYFTVSEGKKVTGAKWVSKEEILSGSKVIRMVLVSYLHSDI